MFEDMKTRFCIISKKSNISGKEASHNIKISKKRQLCITFLKNVSSNTTKNGKKLRKREKTAKRQYSTSNLTRLHFQTKASMKYIDI